MPSEFIFHLTPTDEEALLSQLTKALNKRLELHARAIFPAMWNLTDKLNNRPKAPAHVLRRRRKLNLALTVLFLLMGLFLLIPAMVQPLPGPGIVGALAVAFSSVGLWVKQRDLLALVALPIGSLLAVGALLDFEQLGGLFLLGLIGLLVGGGALFTYKTAHRSTFAKEAAALLRVRSHLPEESFPPVVFSDAGIFIGDSEAIPYSECEGAFETADLYLFLRNDRALLLQKRELINATPAEFSHFLEQHLDLNYCV